VIRPRAALAVVLLIPLAACSKDAQPKSPPVAVPSIAVTATPDLDEAPTEDADSRPQVIGTVAEGLKVPWGIDFLPDGTAIVTERDSARVVTIDDTGTVRTIGRLDDASPQGEAGLLGVAVSPEFATDQTIFFYVSTAVDNRIVRSTYDGKRLSDPDSILENIPNGFIHDGGRLEFGPDGHLYASTGETGDEDIAQDRGNLGGKILRVTTNGDPAPGNPDPDSEVWSFGHRNVQGLAFDDAGRLWASEFGANTWDELNLIEAGQNYGWPLVEGEGPREVPPVEDLINPQVVWSTDDASPSGLAYQADTLWLAALNGERLWRINVSGNQASSPKGFFVGKYGRLRTVVVAPDGNLWVTTSNQDGRGDPSPGDDRILLIRP
jgi:glucose/arabinose dehydrogenase